jgi:hypothetical protein
MPDFDERVRAHVVEAYELVDQLARSDAGPGSGEAETIASVLGDALRKYDRSVVLHVTRSLYSSALLDALDDIDQVA